MSDKFQEFTARKLHAILCKVLRGNAVIPPPDSAELQRLAQMLNVIALRLCFQQAGNLARPMDERVRKALGVLTEFFDVRAATSAGEAKETIEQEAALAAHFHDFVAAMDAHAFELPMDGVVFAPPFRGWQGYASSVAECFKSAMVPTNGIFGYSEDGPISRFVAE